MFCRRFSWFICTFVAFVTATGYSGQDYNSGSESEVTVHYLGTDITESSTAEQVLEIRPSTAVDLGALLDAGEGAVVVLVSGETRLVAHRAVLSARSPVFQRILQDAATGEVAVPDVEGPVLRQLVAHLYTLQAPQLPAVAPQLLAAAHQYGLPALKADCEQQVAAQLSVETAAATAVLAVRHSCDSLRKAAIAYIRAHILNVMATQGWTNAINSQPEVMLKVIQMLSQSPPETSTPASAENRITPTIVPQSVYSSHGQTSASPASPTTSHSTFSSGSTDICLVCSSAPAVGETSPDPAVQPQSDHSGHSGHHTSATATPNMAAQTATQTDASSLLHSLSAKEKGMRLIEAAEEGAVGELEALLAVGVDVEATDDWWDTALHWAAKKGHVEAARRLVAAGAAVEARNRWQGTPLHWAATKGHTAVARLLLAAGAHPSARDFFARTPLHLAAISGHLQVATVLLEAGADREARDQWGNSPLDDARWNDHLQLVELLQGDSSPTLSTLLN